MSFHGAAAALIAVAILGDGRPAAIGPPHAPASSVQSTTARAQGKGSIGGTVTGEPDGGALARARVLLRSAALAQPRVTLTDAKGGFRFDALPAGDYEVTVQRSGWVLPFASGGPARGMAVRLGDGEARSGLALVLQRAATIPGRILDEDGTPAASIEVDALSLRAGDGAPLAPAASARTDDRGEFRITGLPAGQYFLVARDPSFTNVGDETGVLRYAPTYHPGVFSTGEAEPVSVSAGRESPRVEFRLRIVRPARVSGSIATPDRRPLLSGAVLLIARDSALNLPLPADDVEFLPNGRFSLRNVPPGRYQIRARAEIDPDEVMWFSTFTLTVEERDVDGVSMLLAPGASAAGRVDWDRRPGAARPTGPGIRVRAPFADGTSFGDSLTGQVGDGGNFQIRGVMTGSHYFGIEGLPSPWALTSVVWRGRNILDQPTSVAEGERLHDLRLVASPAVAELQGMVRDREGRPSGDVLVVTAAPPPALMSTANPRFRTIRTDSAGRYRLSGLPAGDYRVAALAGTDELLAQRREWLGRVSARGAAVSVPREGVTTLDLTALSADDLPAAVAR
jgi:hypothetical protein